MAFFVAPADYQQGETVRIMYIHVPAAWVSTLSYLVMAAAALATLVWRHPLAEAAQKAAAPLGAAFTFVCLVTGSLWGKPMWGTYWVWDARLTSVLVLFLIDLGLVALWQTIEEPGRAARAASILTLVGVINIPIVKFSVDWWNTLHQPASVFRMGGPTIAASMLWPLLVMAAGYTLLFATFAPHGDAQRGAASQGAPPVDDARARAGAQRGAAAAGEHHARRAGHVTWPTTPVSSSPPMPSRPRSSPASSRPSCSTTGRSNGRWRRSASRSRRGTGDPLPSAVRRMAAMSSPDLSAPAPRPSRAGRILVALPLLGFVGLAALFVVRLGAGDPSLVPSPLIGRPVPAFDLAGLPGLPTPGPAGLPSADFAAGHVTLLNVFASWCVECHDEHAALLALAADPALKDKGVVLDGMDYKDESGQRPPLSRRQGQPVHARGHRSVGPHRH